MNGLILDVEQNQEDIIVEVKENIIEQKKCTSGIRHMILHFSKTLNVLLLHQHAHDVVK